MDSKRRLQLAALYDDQEHGGVTAAMCTAECRSAVSNTLQSSRVPWKLAIKGKELCVLWSWRSDTEGSRLFQQHQDSAKGKGSRRMSIRLE